MRFLELQIKGFGKFHDCDISFEDGINIVYGKNEAGKSTIHTFIRSMLFGLQPARGRAARKDLYSQYEPWENSGTYEGALRMEHGGHIYRIERTFRKDKKELHVIDETLGRELEASPALMDELMCGLTETAYNNTVSIGQLKSATDGGMVSELKNYIANMNTSGNMALNITKASAFLKAQRKDMESQLVPDAARSYTALLGEIKAIEKDVSSPEYENLLPAYQKQRSEAHDRIAEKQKEKEELLQKVARGRQILEQNQFKDMASIEQYEQSTNELFTEYQATKAACEKKSRKMLFFLGVLLTLLLAAGAAGSCLIPDIRNLLTRMNLIPQAAALILAGGAVLAAVITFLLRNRSEKLNRALAQSGQTLQETFRRHLGDASLTPEALESFRSRMAEFKRLSTAMDKSEESIAVLAGEIDGLLARQTDCSDQIEKQQKLQWDLEKKLELLSNYKDQLESLRRILAENQRISQELEAIDLAQETMTELSTSIRDSFGLYLNKTASDLISGITGGIYTSMSIDENLNVFMNTKTRLVPIEQVSSGTMDQIYLALRLSAAKLIQGERGTMPLIFDDSFVLYDDERLRSALRWLASAFTGQIVIFTCHQREAQMLTANQIPYRLIRI